MPKGIDLAYAFVAMDARREIGEVREMTDANDGNVGVPVN